MPRIPLRPFPRRFPFRSSPRPSLLSVPGRVPRRSPIGHVTLVHVAVLIWGLGACTGDPAGPAQRDSGSAAARLSAGGSLAVWSGNPRYYAVGGAPVLLLGGGPTVTPGATAPIDEVVSNGGNHIRLWHTVPANPPYLTLNFCIALQGVFPARP